jgi:hypothetical protein
MIAAEVMMQSRFWEGVAPRAYEEKRKFHRMTLDCPLTFGLAGETKSTAARCLNLSSSGVLFVTERAVQVGSLLRINITPQKAVVPPLDAVAEVLRIVPDADPNRYRIAARITELS